MVDRVLLFRAAAFLRAFTLVPLKDFCTFFIIFSATCFIVAIFFWQPIASIVTTGPESDKSSNNSGMAVISLDFSDVLNLA